MDTINSKEKIENHPAWKYISKLSNSERYTALTGKLGLMAEKSFNVTIEEWAFTRLPEIPADWVSISATDTMRNVSMIMVLKPNTL